MNRNLNVLIGAALAAVFTIGCSVRSNSKDSGGPPATKPLFETKANTPAVQPLVVSNEKTHVHDMTVSNLNSGTVSSLFTGEANLDQCFALEFISNATSDCSTLNFFAIFQLERLQNEKVIDSHLIDYGRTFCVKAGDKYQIRASLTNTGKCEYYSVEFAVRAKN